MMDDSLLEGLCFTCQQCSLCCRKEPGFVYLSEKDLTNLCHWFNLNSEVFIKKYCRFVPYYDGSEVLCLLEKSNYDCIFWDQGCTVYKARPIQCRTYPFWDSIIDNIEAWNYESNSCPGINVGKCYSAQEIRGLNSLYALNVPIKRIIGEKDEG